MRVTGCRTGLRLAIVEAAVPPSGMNDADRLPVGPHVPSLTGRTVSLIAGALLVVPLLVLIVKDRLPGPRLARSAQRLVLVVAAQAGAVGLVFLLVNGQLALYASCADLLGQQPAPVPGRHPTLAQQAVQRRVAQAKLAAPMDRAVKATPRRALDGVLVHTRLRGPVSDVQTSMDLYLPPQYFQPAYARVRFPVAELLVGHPGSPAAWTHRLRVDADLRAGVAAHTSIPFVLLMPNVNVAGRLDTACYDVVDGPAVDTLLGVDVPAVAKATMRVRRDAAGWAVGGYSEGGYCGAYLAQRHPSTFTAVLGLSGAYNSSKLALGAPVIYGTDPRRKLEASPEWRITHLPGARLHYLLTASREETDGTFASTVAFAAAVRAPSTADTIYLAHGGHNPRNWARILPHALSWLSQLPGMDTGMPASDRLTAVSQIPAWSRAS